MKAETCGFVCLVLFLLAFIAVLPVSAVTLANSSPTGMTIHPSPTSGKAMISATISSSTALIGDAITLSGVETGSNTTDGVQLWVFAGNYVNVTTIPVNADGSFSKTFNSTGYPPANYYAFLQSPGPDGKFNIVFQNSGVYSGGVVNTVTGARIFNFTGVGSVQDAVAAQELSNAINNQGNDDVYTKLTFQLMTSVPSTTAPASTSYAQATETTTAVPPTQSSITSGIAFVALVAICLLVRAKR